MIFRRSEVLNFSCQDLNRKTDKRVTTVGVLKILRYIFKNATQAEGNRTEKKNVSNGFVEKTIRPWRLMAHKMYHISVGTVAADMI